MISFLLSMFLILNKSSKSYLVIHETHRGSAQLFHPQKSAATLHIYCSSVQLPKNSNSIKTFSKMAKNSCFDLRIFEQITSQTENDE